MTKQAYEGHEIPIYSVKSSEKFKDIKVRFNVYETSITSRMAENVCISFQFLIVTDWFSPVIASKVFCI